MAAEGKSSRGINELYGFKNKYVIKQLLRNHREQESEKGIISCTKRKYRHRAATLQ